MTIMENEMSEKNVPVAEIKARLSEYLAVSHNEKKRIIITKRGKPFAAIVSMEDLKSIRQLEEKRGLAEIAGKWEGFNEIADSIEEVYSSRSKDRHRDVSF